MKGIHPEFVLEVKGEKIDKAISFMNIVDERDDTDDRTIEDILDRKKLLEREKKRLMIEGDHYRYLKDQYVFSGRLNTFGMIVKNMYHFKQAWGKNAQGAVYRVGKEFFNSVSKLRREIPFKIIGAEDKPIYIKTPLVKFGMYTYNGAYISTYNEGSIMIILTAEGDYSITQCRVIMCMDITPTHIKDTINLSNLMVNEKFNAHDEELPAPFYTNIEYNEDEEEKLISYIVSLVNTAVYVNSQDPEIEELKPLKLWSKKDYGSLPAEKKDAVASLPVRLINWSYHTGRTYSVGETAVEGHWRHQWVGEGRTMNRMVWVKQHVRHYGS